MREIGIYVAAIVGLLTIAGLLWRGLRSTVAWGKKIGDGIDTLQTVPGQVKALEGKVDTQDGKISAIDTKVDGISLQALHDNSEVHTALGELKTSHRDLDGRLRGVEQGVAALMYHKGQKEQETAESPP